MQRKSYEGAVACLPVTIPYRRYSTNSAQWWLGRALHELVKRARLRLKDIDGFAVSSFTVGPDTAVGLTQHFGLSPRWLDHIPFGGASGIVALRRAARAVRTTSTRSARCFQPFPALRRTRFIRTDRAVPTHRSRSSRSTT